MLTEIRIPVRPNGSSAFEKVGRRAGDWAVVSCGVAVWLDDGVITDARVGLAAVGPNTTGIPAVSQALRGRPPSEDLYAEAGAIAARALHAGHRPARQRRLQAPPRGRADPAGAAPGGRPHRRPRRRREP